jgi:hypothetical protein
MAWVGINPWLSKNTAVKSNTSATNFEQDRVTIKNMIHETCNRRRHSTSSIRARGSRGRCKMQPFLANLGLCWDGAALPGD